MADIQSDGRNKTARAARVQRLKKMIVLTVLITILLPFLLCTILFIRINNMQKEIGELKELILAMETRQDTASKNDIVETELTVNEIESVEVAPPYLGSEEAKEQPQMVEDIYDKKVYLTFDDGPSGYTNEILDILAEYNIKATFFVVGKTDEDSIEAYKRIVEEGHTLGMHSFSHKYKEIYSSLETYAQDLTRLQEFLYLNTGVWCKYVRFPGGSSNAVSSVSMSELIGYLEEQGLQYYDWNISSGDATSQYISAQTIVDNIINTYRQFGTSIVLMHDATDKQTTIEALPIVIEQLQGQEDVAILPITDETVIVQHIISGN